MRTRPTTCSCSRRPIRKPAAAAYRPSCSTAKRVAMPCAPSRSKTGSAFVRGTQYATEAAFNAAHDAIEVHGAYGYSAEYPVERFLRNARAPIIYEGTREVHTILQGEYALGYREDRPVKRSLPPYQPD